MCSSGHSGAKFPINVWKRPTERGVPGVYVGRGILDASAWLPHWGSCRAARRDGRSPFRHRLRRRHLPPCGGGFSARPGCPRPTRSASFVGADVPIGPRRGQEAAPHENGALSVIVRRAAGPTRRSVFLGKRNGFPRPLRGLGMTNGGGKPRPTRSAPPRRGRCPHRPAITKEEFPCPPITPRTTT